MNTNSTISGQGWIDQQRHDPAFAREFDSLEPAYQVARLRILRGLTQQELADKVGTQQPSIARIESGKRRASIAMLDKIAEALDAELVVSLRPR